jgi:hypothetical protein
MKKSPKKNQMAKTMMVATALAHLSLLLWWA